MTCKKKLTPTYYKSFGINECFMRELTNFNSELFIDPNIATVIETGCPFAVANLSYIGQIPKNLRKKRKCKCY